MQVRRKLANKKTERGSIPETVHLSDVQKYLYQIQQTLLKHNMFWKSVLVFLESLKSETFSNEHFIEENELKEIVLMHIDLAQEAPSVVHNPRVSDLQFLPEDEGRGAADPLQGVGRDHPGGGGEDGGERKRQHLRTQTCNWKAFGESCLTAKRAFSLQNKDAYNFLEFNPSSLSPEEWKRQYDIVIADLTRINTAIGAH
ncbi:hypothetical protein R3I93_022337 [Phoxinus phoxinus]|uniref:Uncharacterized protein n=1 Tax=Phoxinus phoxinus TaxID=58324 RepID=A0AAN9C4J1_9TELE